MSAPREEYKNTNPAPGTPFFKDNAVAIAKKHDIHTLEENLPFGAHTFPDQQRIIGVALDRALENTPKTDRIYAAIVAMITDNKGIEAEAARVSGHPEEWPFFTQTLRNAKAKAAQ